MAARQLRLERAAAMVDAIRKPRVHLFAAEMEIRFTWMAHWPAANTIIEIEQAGLASYFGARLRGDEAARRSGRNWCLLVTRALAKKAAGPNRNNPWLR